MDGGRLRSSCTVVRGWSGKIGRPAVVTSAVLPQPYCSVGPGHILNLSAVSPVFHIGIADKWICIGVYLVVRDQQRICQSNHSHALIIR